MTIHDTRLGRTSDAIGPVRRLLAESLRPQRIVTWISVMTLAIPSTGISRRTWDRKGCGRGYRCGAVIAAASASLFSLVLVTYRPKRRRHEGSTSVMKAAGRIVEGRVSWR
jgi:hypothetical protein